MASLGQRVPIFLKRRLGRVPSTWSIGLITGDSLEGLQISEPVLSPGFKPIRDFALAADPFFIPGDDMLCIYFEGVLGNETKGQIHWAAITRDEVAYGGRAIHEPFHMSFPYVFHDEALNCFCMIPESSEMSQIRLYVAEQASGPWELHRVLAEGRPFVDTVAFRRSDSWFLVTESSGGTNDRRELRRAGSLDEEFITIGEWQIDPSRCRMAGRLVVDGAGASRQSVHLLTQDCSTTYGRSISHEQFDVLALSRKPDESSDAAPPFGESTALVHPSVGRWFHSKVHSADLRVGSHGVVGVIDGKGKSRKMGAAPDGLLKTFVDAATRSVKHQLP